MKNLIPWYLANISDTFSYNEESFTYHQCLFWQDTQGSTQLAYTQINPSLNY